MTDSNLGDLIAKLWTLYEHLGDEALISAAVWNHLRSIGIGIEVYDE